MRIWIDTEFNEFRGELISMALVAEDGREWYYALNCHKPGAWVAQHVMPVVGIAPVPQETFVFQLWQFLQGFHAVHLVADWPEDIEHFMRALIIGPGQRIDTPPLTMEVRRDIDSSASAIPHNALADARAVRDAHLAIEQA